MARPTGRLTESVCSTISKEITDDTYSSLGLELGLTDARLQQILGDNHYKIKNASLRMLIEFKQSKASEKEAYSVLHTALGVLAMGEVQGKLEEKAGDPPQVVQANGPIRHPAPELDNGGAKQPLENDNSMT